MKNTYTTKTAIIRYIGAIPISNTTIFSPITGTAKFDTNKDASYKGIYMYKQDVEPCPLPCCEECPEASDPIIFTECDQSKAFT